MQNQNTKPAPAPANQPVAHHRVRTAFASLFGILAVLLIMSSVVSIWLNRTLTVTTTFVGVVAPLAQKPEIQNFVAQKASEELVKNAPTQDLANVLLPAGAATGKSDEQVKALLQPIVYSNVIKVVSSPAFAQVWTNTNQTAHTALVNQLNNPNSDQLSLDLNPLVVSVVDQLKATDLGQQVGDQIEIKPDTGKINLQNSGIEKAHSSYTAFKSSTIVVIVLALICLAASIALSVHHLKTIRRILIGTGVSSLLLAASVQVPALVAVKTVDVTTQKAVIVIVQSVLHNLQIASLILGLVCITVAIGTKVGEMIVKKKA